MNRHAVDENDRTIRPVFLFHPPELVRTRVRNENGAVDPLSANQFMVFLHDQFAIQTFRRMHQGFVKQRLISLIRSGGQGDPDPELLAPFLFRAGKDNASDARLFPHIFLTLQQRQRAPDRRPADPVGLHEAAFRRQFVSRRNFAVADMLLQFLVKNHVFRFPVHEKKTF